MLDLMGGTGTGKMQFCCTSEILCALRGYAVKGNFRVRHKTKRGKRFRVPSIRKRAWFPCCFILLPKMVAQYDEILEESGSVSSEAIWKTTEIRHLKPNWTSYRDARLIEDRWVPSFDLKRHDQERRMPVPACDTSANYHYALPPKKEAFMSLSAPFKKLAERSTQCLHVRDAPACGPYDADWHLSDSWLQGCAVTHSLSEGTSAHARFLHFWGLAGLLRGLHECPEVRPRLPTSMRSSLKLFERAVCMRFFLAYRKMRVPTHKQKESQNESCFSFFYLFAWLCFQGCEQRGSNTIHRHNAWWADEGEQVIHFTMPRIIFDVTVLWSETDVVHLRISYVISWLCAWSHAFGLQQSVLLATRFPLPLHAVKCILCARTVTCCYIHTHPHGIPLILNNLLSQGYGQALQASCRNPSGSICCPFRPP